MKKTILLVLAALAAAMLAGCAAAQPTATPVPPTPVPDPFPMTLADSLGREVSLDALPERIVSLAPSNTEILFAVGAGDVVVGVTNYCNYPAQAQEREQIGGFTAQTISIETIVALEPDLAFAYSDSQAPVVEALKGVGIPVLVLAPSSFDDVYANIALVGQATGNEAMADEVVAEMQARIAAVVDAVAALPEEERLTVFWETFDEPLMTAGPSTFTGQMIELAGGVNVFAELEEAYPQISAEEVIARNPAVIMGSDTHGVKLNPETIAARPGWAEMDATVNGRIHLIDGDIVSRAGPRLADAVEAMARALYPDLFE